MDTPVTFLAQWGSEGRGDGQFDGAEGIAVDEKRNVYVTDFQNHRVQKFNPSGTFLAKWDSRGCDDGQFIYPQGIAVDFEGKVYVVDRDNGRVQVFGANGGFLGTGGHSAAATANSRPPHG